MNQPDDQFDDLRGNPSEELPTELRQLFAAARRDVAPVLDVTTQVRLRIAQTPPTMLAATMKPSQASVVNHSSRPSATSFAVPTNSGWSWIVPRPLAVMKSRVVGLALPDTRRTRSIIPCPPVSAEHIQ